MDEIEEANKSAVESCQRVLSLFSQSQDQLKDKNLMVETGNAVLKFKKVVSLLSNTTSVGHGRVRKLKKLTSSLPQTIFLENPNHKTIFSPKTLKLLPSIFLEHPNPDIDSKPKTTIQITQKMFQENPGFDFGASVKPPLLISQQSPSNHHQFLQQQQLHLQKLHIQQQHMKRHADVMYSSLSRSNNNNNSNNNNSSGINLKFDCSNSSNRSFISSLSMDSSLLNLDGNSFHLIGVPQPSDQHPRRRCSGRVEDGSVKCGTSGKCHCSKRRSVFYFLDPLFGA